MLDKVSKVCYPYHPSPYLTVFQTHLRYLMGHTRSSTLSVTTYQAPDRPVDVSGSRFSEEGPGFAEMSEAHSSAAWNRPQAPSDDLLKNDPAMKALVAESAIREQRVKDKFGPETTSEDLFHNVSASVYTLTLYTDSYAGQTRSAHPLSS